MDPVNALPRHRVDCLVIGAGPAGLAASIYLARYRREVCVVDGGDSRAARIPLSRNVPGFPDGIAGPRLVERIRRQAEAAGVVVAKGTVEALAQDAHGFVARLGEQAVSARRVLLASGCGDRHPIDGLDHEATWSGRIRWCPVCDAYEAIDRRVLLVADGEHGEAHALFLRTYTRALCLVMAPGEPALPPSTRERLHTAGVDVIEGVPARVILRPGRPGLLELASGHRHRFDVMYPMTGGRPRVALARRLGARCGDDGRLLTDRRQQTSVPGLYAAGDVVASLSQVSVATAEGALAATAIHRSLPRNFR